MTDHPTRLYAEQTAEAGKCGSCKLFNREKNDANYLQYAPTRGTCRLVMPPWIKLQHTYAQVEKGGPEFVENSCDWTLVKDTEGCSFWQTCGLTFVKDQVWAA